MAASAFLSSSPCRIWGIYTEILYFRENDVGVIIDMIEEKIMNGEIELLVSNYKNLMCGPNEDFNVSSGTNLQWLER